jgi:hypothetical protein
MNQLISALTGPYCRLHLTQQQQHNMFKSWTEGEKGSHKADCRGKLRSLKSLLQMLFGECDRDGDIVW